MSAVSDMEKLSDEELISLAQKGDDEAMACIIDRYRELVSARARLYFILGSDQADVVQEGMIGLFKSIQTYDEDREATFKTYATICVNRQILDAVRAANRKKHIPLNTSISLEGREEAVSESFDAIEVSLRIEEEAKNNFSKLEQQVWELYMNGLSQKEIAKKLKKDDKSIYNAMERVKRKIKNLFE